MNNKGYEVEDPIYDVDGIPSLKKAIPLGLQHTFAMMVGNMLPAILIANAIGADAHTSATLMQGAMLGAAIGTMIQLYPIKLFGGIMTGSRLPVMMGMNFIFLSACLSVISTHGIGTMYGAQLISSIIAVLMGVFLVDKIMKLITPLISGIIVICMSLGLFSTAMNNMAGGEGAATYGNIKNLLVGLIVAIIILVLNKYGKGMIKDTSILIGIVLGYIISLALGMVDFSGVSEATLFAFPKPMIVPLEFNLNTIITFSMIFLVAITAMIGCCAVITTGAMDREMTKEELSSSVVGMGLGSIVSTIFNGVPIGGFSQNAAITSMNKVISRFVIAMGTILLFLAGMSPKICAIIGTIPNAVMGGATLVVFSNILTSGIVMIASDFEGDNPMIAGLSIGASIGVLMVPEMLDKLPEFLRTLLGSSNIVIGVVIAVVLQVSFKKKENSRLN